MSNLSTTVYSLLTECSSEADMEYVMNASADYKITNPKLGLSKGSGRVKAAIYDIKQGAKYDLYKTAGNVWILLKPLRSLLREIPASVEKRTQRLINPQLPEDALTTELGIMRMSMIGKCVLGTWTDPQQQDLFYSNTRSQRLANYLNQFH